jgi:hypothetical protein
MIRILATSGIATGVLEESISVPSPDESLRFMITRAYGEGSSLLNAHVISGKGCEIPNPNIIWFDEKGGEIGRGRSFDTRSLPEGQHLVRATALNLGAGKVEATWIVDKQHLPESHLDVKDIFGSLEKGVQITKTKEIK